MVIGGVNFLTLRETAELIGIAPATLRNRRSDHLAASLRRRWVQPCSFVRMT